MHYHELPRRQRRGSYTREYKGNIMKKMKLVLMVFFTILMATTVYTQELKSVSFDDYLKKFDYKERKGMKIEIPEIMADGDRIRYTLINLVHNAIKFNRPGGVVTVRAFAPDDAGALRVVVEDTGVGIPAGAIEKVFNRFYRVDRARSRELGGTGLGLAIVKHLMRLHGGAVRVESEAGRGTRFILEFPGDMGSSGGESRA